MMNPVVLRLPDDIKQQLELESRRQKQSLAEAIRRAITIYLKEKPKQKSAAEVMLEWAERSGKYKSNYKDTDLSTNYKQYLYGPKSGKFGHLWKKST